MHRKFCSTERLKSRSDELAAARISTEEVDRDGDIVRAAGLDLAAYKQNPVVLYAHDSHEVPVGRAVEVVAEPGIGVRAQWRWNASDPLGGRVKQAWDAGFLNATSIGFRPIRYTENKHGGLTFQEAELYEFSVVPVPANAGALRGLKALGLRPQRSALNGDNDDATSIVLPDGREIEITDETDDELCELTLPSGNTIDLTRADLRRAAREVVHEALGRAFRRGE